MSEPDPFSFFGVPMMRRFGSHGPEELELVATPVGTACGFCGEKIAEGDTGPLCPAIQSAASRDGVPLISPEEAAKQLVNSPVWVPFHEDCFLRTVIGSVGHQMGRCYCVGGTEEDPAGMTKRQGATAACDLFRSVMAARRGSLQ